MHSTKKDKQTPLMKQYSSIKSKYPDTIILFRVGDFYETFGEDAIKASEILDIVLTKRSNGAAASVELAGFPHHALENYIPKLLRNGIKVAVCDQLEDPKYAKGIVKRGVTEIITPGLAYSDSVVDRKSNNFLASLYIEKQNIGLSLLDLSTGEFLVTEGVETHIKKVLQSFSPKEIVISKKQKSLKETIEFKNTTSYLDDWAYEYNFAINKLHTQFKVQSLKGYGVHNMTLGIIAAGAIMRYLEQTENHNLSHINKITRIDDSNFVWLDAFTIKNLELVQPQNSEGTSLLKILDKTNTAMGARLLKKWLLMPLISIDEINTRLNLVEIIYKNQSLREKLICYFKNISDLERLCCKISTMRINPREVIALKISLSNVTSIKKLLEDNKQLFDNYANYNNLSIELSNFDEIIKQIDRTIIDNPPLLLSNGNYIKDGVNDKLDEIRSLITQSETYLRGYRENLVQETGIASLKISFNKIFGYYIEVTNAHKNKVPNDWIRKQTLVNAERYITEELKKYEDKIINAELEIQTLEQQIFKELIQKLSEYIATLQSDSREIAQLDCITSFAIIAIENNYNRPVITDTSVIDIKKGRHPVIEKTLDIGSKYAPNDIFLDQSSQQIIIITGPNMSGKSAILRQTALIVILAQIGCFLPADKATIGIIDKIFTRVGASDNLSKGESTFMVEMNETASIINNLSEKSLVIMDEIGRGTSTYDGIAIAKSIVEYLNTCKFKPKTLFATHYHELNEMANISDGIKNYNVKVVEQGNDIIFLHKLIKGGSNHSFGINVAKLAGLPTRIVKRAKMIMEKLEEKNQNNLQKSLFDTSPEENVTSNPFIHDVIESKILEQKQTEKESEIIKFLREIDINQLTPLEAFNKIVELTKSIDSGVEVKMGL